MSAPMFPDLAGRTALVTGSTRGIGAGLADALEAAGLRVLRHGSPEHVRDNSTADAPRTGVLAADLASEPGVDHLIRSVHEHTDQLDVLVNNAGVETPGDASGAALARTLAVNLAAPVLLTRGLAPILAEGGGGSVINITSIHDTVAYAGNVAYVASKAGLEAAGRTLALELAPSGIRVNSVAPGAIETDINRDVIDEMGRDRFESWIPLRRVGVTEDLIGAVLYLASDASSYVTGSRLLVDGGYSQALLRYRLDT